jgi:alkylhydroperoxidase family enzyme
MSKNTNRASWLRIDDVTDPAPEIAAMWEESRQRLGYVREFLKLPFGRQRLKLFQGYVNRLMHSDDCLLSGRERELVALVVSLENRWMFCSQTGVARISRIAMRRLLSSRPT